MVHVHEYSQIWPQVTEFVLINLRKGILKDKKKCN